METNSSVSQQFRKPVGAIIAYFPSSLNAHKLINIFIANAKFGPNANPYHFIEEKHILATLGSSTRNHKHLRKVLDEVQTIKFEWDILSEEQSYFERLRDGLTSDFNEAIQNPFYKPVIASEYFQSLVQAKAKARAVESNASDDAIDEIERRQIQALIPIQSMDVIVPSIRYHEQGLISYQFNASVAPVIANPYLYTTLNCKDIALFKTKYGLRLFELVQRYKLRSDTQWMDLDQLSKVLGVPLNDQGRFVYHELKSLRQKVINPAIKEINALSSQLTHPIQVGFEKETRKGTKRFRFCIETTSDPLSSQDFTERQRACFKLLLKHGINEALITEFVRRHSYDYLRAQIAFVSSKASQTGYKSELAGGFLVNAIRENLAKFTERQGGNKKGTEQAVTNTHPDTRTFDLAVLEQKFFSDTDFYESLFNIPEFNNGLKLARVVDSKTLIWPIFLSTLQLNDARDQVVLSQQTLEQLMELNN